jgi:hypothetical protein
MTEDSANQTTIGHDVFVSYASQDEVRSNGMFGTWDARVFRVSRLRSREAKSSSCPLDKKPSCNFGPSG